MYSYDFLCGGTKQCMKCATIVSRLLSVHNTDCTVVNVRHLRLFIRANYGLTVVHLKEIFILINFYLIFSESFKYESNQSVAVILMLRNVPVYCILLY